MEWLKNLSFVKRIGYGVAIFGVVALVGKYINLSPHLPDHHEDSLLEEMLEDKIEKETGIKLDLSKDSPEES